MTPEELMRVRRRLYAEIDEQDGVIGTLEEELRDRKIERNKIAYKIMKLTKDGWEKEVDTWEEETGIEQFRAEITD